MKVNLVNGTQLRSKIFAIAEGKDIYINENSFEVAKDIYLYEMFEDEISDQLTLKNSDDDMTITMDYFRRIKTSGPGTIILEGIYNVNNKVEIRITITVTE